MVAVPAGLAVVGVMGVIGVIRMLFTSVPFLLLVSDLCRLIASVWRTDQLERFSNRPCTTWVAVVVLLRARMQED